MIEQCLDPVWTEGNVFDIPPPRDALAAELVIDVYDWDEVFD